LRNKMVITRYCLGCVNLSLDDEPSSISVKPRPRSREIRNPAAPSLRAYPVHTVIAEKLHAMVVLGVNNSRMKEFFDLAVIARTSELDGSTLGSAIRATFARRNTSLPTSVPAALTAEF